MTQTFTRMDESTQEQWAVIGTETFKNQGRVAERVLGLLQSLSDITDGFATDQLTHCLQTATMAERADQLCHAHIIPKVLRILARDGVKLNDELRPTVHEVVKLTRQTRDLIGEAKAELLELETGKRPAWGPRRVSIPTGVGA